MSDITEFLIGLLILSVVIFLLASTYVFVRLATTEINISNSEQAHQVIKIK